ncbi:MAG: NAD-dependent epimerase/dehydratase family protein [Roseburia sp.]|nr:NAD-dependent epimerase/dehydratase family protein [Roseburia sp.]
MTTIAITGATGNMGAATFAMLETAEHIDKIKLLCRSEKRARKLLKKHKALRDKTEIVLGEMSDRSAVTELVRGAQLVINMAAVIPPKSDAAPRAAQSCNEVGANVLAEVIENTETDQPALIHISTVALYGNRTGAHRFARVGDPLLVSPFDVYSATKLRGEFRILESKIEKWAILRQTAMLHSKMFNDNLHDGLMFHTVFDAPLEWVTAHDSGLLMRNIAEAFASDCLPDGFWNKCYDITGGKANRRYGIGSYDDGFAPIGAKTKMLFRPGDNVTRNFHGVWYADEKLNAMFDYQTQSVTDYWRGVYAAHPIFKIGKIVPKRLIRRLLIDRLKKSRTAPHYWAKHGDDARLTAYFGGRAQYEKLQNTDWSDFPVPDGERISEIEGNASPVFYGFDFDKPDSEIDKADLESVAAAHGGRLVTEQFRTGDMYTAVEWETQDGERFFARPYTVLRAGHWHSSIYDEYVWDFDRLAKKDKVFASIWYDSHAEDEDVRYFLDDDLNAHAQKLD